MVFHSFRCNSIYSIWMNRTIICLIKCMLMCAVHIRFSLTHFNVVVVVVDSLMFSFYLLLHLPTLSFLIFCLLSSARSPNGNMMERSYTNANNSNFKSLECVHSSALALLVVMHFMQVSIFMHAYTLNANADAI